MAVVRVWGGENFQSSIIIKLFYISKQNRKQQKKRFTKEFVYYMRKVGDFPEKAVEKLK
jgi:hypothetical protein